jgi:hypothetical protein
VAIFVAICVVKCGFDKGFGTQGSIIGNSRA